MKVLKVLYGLDRVGPVLVNLKKNKNAYRMLIIRTGQRWRNEKDIWCACLSIDTLRCFDTFEFKD